MRQKGWPSKRDRAEKRRMKAGGIRGGTLEEQIRVILARKSTFAQPDLQVSISLKVKVTISCGISSQRNHTHPFLSSYGTFFPDFSIRLTNSWCVY